MGLMNKLKNILFEEEEVEIPVIEKKETKKEKKEPDAVSMEMPRKEETPIRSNFYDDLKPVIDEEINIEKQNTPLKKEPEFHEEVSEREIFRSEKTFNFPAFDEEEFESMTPRKSKTNILEHEKITKKEEYKEPERKKEPTQKFKPSPIISPVYGILDKNYTPDEITSRADSKLDVESVRKKAFGIPEKKVEVPPTIEDDILEEKLEKARTIDELLKDSSDEVITIDEEKEDTLEIKSPETSYNEPVETLEDIEPTHEINKEEDTLESDLFDLIDSMYENREDGE